MRSRIRRRHQKNRSLPLVPVPDPAKPREEITYDEFYPDLDTEPPLKVFITGREINKGEGAAQPGKQITNGNGNGTAPETNGHIITDSCGVSKNNSSLSKTFVTTKFTKTPFTADVYNPTDAVVRDKINKKPTFTKLPVTTQKETKLDKSLVSAGFLETDTYVLPKVYIRSDMTDAPLHNDVELVFNPRNNNGTLFEMKTDKNIRVEYDMDEQDNFFLEDLNDRRINEQSIPPISPQIFEILMTLLEKEWFSIEQKLLFHKTKKTPNGTENPDDQKCEICDESECDNSNAILFCDGCNLAVHQECYGVPFIPEGQWLCRKCMVSRKKKLKCIFCPTTTGAFKQTSDNRWAHVSCGLWIPEVSFANQFYMEPIDGLDLIPKGRWKLICYICKKKMGACIQCSYKNCFRAFHVTCAQKAGLCLQMEHGIQAILNRTGQISSYCDKHCSKEWLEANNTINRLEELHQHHTNHHRSLSNKQKHINPYVEIEKSIGTSGKPSLKIRFKLKPRKNLQKDTKKWRTSAGIPILPEIIYESISVFLYKHSILRSKELASELCRYWVLKKEMKRGAALIKRLDSFNQRTFPDGEDSEEILEFAKYLLQDLQKLRDMATLVHNREETRMNIIELQRQQMEALYFPSYHKIWPIIIRIMNLTIDNAELFEHSNDETPASEERLTATDLYTNVCNYKYETLDEFKKDVITYFDKSLESFELNSQSNKTITRLKKDLLKRFDHNMLEPSSSDTMIDKKNRLIEIENRNININGMELEEKEWIGARLLRAMSPFSDEE